MAQPPLLLVVSGAPGSGKTTLAKLLGDELRLPIVSRDELNEVLLDHYESRDRSESQLAGSASFKLTYLLIERLVEAFVSTIVETNFKWSTAEPELRYFSVRAQIVVIHCDAPEAIIERRLIQRAETSDRHHRHFDRESLQTVIADIAAGAYEPLELGAPTLRVATEFGYSPVFEDIIHFIRENAVPLPGR